MDWPKSKPLFDGERILFEFENGYGASMIRHSGSYGGNQGKWEIAVLRDGAICYDTPITDDVIGHLDDPEADAILEKIAALPPVRGAQ